MDYGEFLKEFAKIAFLFRVSPNNGIIRTGADYGFRCRCPIAAVYELKIGRTFNKGIVSAASDLGLEIPLAQEIVVAADYQRSHRFYSERTRRDLMTFISKARALRRGEGRSNDSRL